MKTFLAITLLALGLSPLALQATDDLTAADITGTWETFRTGGGGGKTIGEGPFIFTLRIDSEGIKGGAIIGSYPGYLTVTSGQIEGDRIFLEANARLAPGVRFYGTGTIHNGVLSLTIKNEPIRALRDQGLTVEGRKVLPPRIATSN